MAVDGSGFEFAAHFDNGVPDLEGGAAEVGEGGELIGVLLGGHELLAGADDFVEPVEAAL